MPRLIDADALLSQVKRSREKNPYTGAMLESLNAVYDFTHRDVLNLINYAPTIDTEPVRHGWWILKVHDKRVNYLWTVTAYCSECCDEEKEIWYGYFPGVPDCLAHDVALQDAKQVKLSNYCPNCGAKMRGDTDETE